MSKIDEIEELKKKYKFKSGDVLTLQILAIAEDCGMTYEQLKENLTNTDKNPLNSQNKAE